MPIFGCVIPPPMKILVAEDEEGIRSFLREALELFGHTVTEYLPEELSSYTPEDPKDMWAGPCTIGLDTGAGTPPIVASTASSGW